MERNLHFCKDKRDKGTSLSVQNTSVIGPRKLMIFARVIALPRTQLPGTAIAQHRSC
jgi:hypothetical protein